MKKNKKRSSKKKVEANEKKTISQTAVSSKRETSSGTMEIEDGIQVERRKAYVEPLTRQILRNLLESEKEGEILPSYHPASGFTYESRLPEKGNGPERMSTEFLENLTKLGILQKSFYDSVSTCPICETPAITLHPSCPKCKSRQIEKANLTEHIPCGYIDQRGKYANGLCPKCGKRLNEGEYRNMGRWYVCSDCGERFEHPYYNLICGKCNNSFSTEEANVLEVPKFTLNSKRRKEIQQNVTSLENIGNLLVDLGFKVEMPGTVTGDKSGIEYHFSILAKKQTEYDELVVAVDHEVAEEKVQAHSVILYVYKISEMKVDIPVFIALPKLGEAARKIAMGHGILIIEGSSEGKERLAQIKAKIEDRINQIIAAQAEKAAAEEEVKGESADGSETAPLNLEVKSQEKPFLTKWKSLRLRGNGQVKSESSTASEKPSVHKISAEDNLGRNIVFLLDSSSSMKKKIGDAGMSSYEVASEAINKILTEPNRGKGDVLSVILFWDELLKGFRNKVLMKNVQLSKQSSPFRLSFGKPKNNAGTPIWDAIEYAIGVLQGKEGHKIVKLITDAVDFPRLKNNATLSKLENSSIQLDLVIAGDKGYQALEKMAEKHNISRFFAAENVDSMILALTL
jgi:predicted RNA-binding Zn-ribbon protein involved in translation (DUF1610 family)